MAFSVSANNRKMRKHVLLIKKSPKSGGLFMADISDIPAGASIYRAKLYLHLDTKEGLAYSDRKSVLMVYECPRIWNWNYVNGSKYASGKSWRSAGGDYGKEIRKIDILRDIVNRGFHKHNPNTNFDFTDYVKRLQRNR